MSQVHTITTLVKRALQRHNKGLKDLYPVAKKAQAKVQELPYALTQDLSPEVLAKRSVTKRQLDLKKQFYAAPKDLRMYREPKIVPEREHPHRLERRFLTKEQEVCTGPLYPGEVVGSYHSRIPENVGPLMGPGMPRKAPFRPIQAVPVPGARIGKFNPEEWQKVSQKELWKPKWSDKPGISIPKGPEELTQELRKDYDFVEFPDLAARQPELDQIVQINPGKAIRRTRDPKTGKWKYWLFGAGATAAGQELLSPEEAEAMPRGVFQKLTKAIIKGEQSSAAKVLKGHTIGGKVIRDVRKTGHKSSGTSRAILFDDGTMMTVSNQDLQDIARRVGTEKYMSKLKTGSVQDQTEQALKSLQYHLKRAKPWHSRQDVKQAYFAHQRRLKEMTSGPRPKGELVEYEGVTLVMPEKYVNILEGLGMIKRIKGAKGLGGVE